MRVYPVINCPDFRSARERASKIREHLGNVGFVHLDVFDGAFTFHKSWADASKWKQLDLKLPLEVHLMVECPADHLDPWLAAGAKRFIIHLETVTPETFAEISGRCRAAGAEAMLSSKPETPTRALEPFIKSAGSGRPLTKLFQILAVEPGSAGQRFLPLTLRKVEYIRRHLPDATIEVDGGITSSTARRAQKAGADIVVSSSYLFESEDIVRAYNELTELIPPKSEWYEKSSRPSRRTAGGISGAHFGPLTPEKIRELELMANRLRSDVIDMVSRAGSGHIAGPLDMADIFTAMYFYIMNHDPKRPGWGGRDRLVLSNGHICPIQYAALAHAGYFPVEELKTLRQLGSRLQGHPHRKILPGIETTSGPLGSGLSQAIGMALAARLDGKKWRTYCMTSDGEHEEGNIWEAVLFAGKNKLNNLTVFIDRNNIQIDGFTENIMPLEPLRAKYESFNWHVLEIDGHNFEEIISAAAEARAIYEKPTVVIAHTIAGKGIDFMENDYLWHSKPFKPGEAEKALSELRTLRGKIKSEHE